MQLQGDHKATTGQSQGNHTATTRQPQDNHKTTTATPHSTTATPQATTSSRARARGHYSKTKSVRKAPQQNQKQPQTRNHTQAITRKHQGTSGRVGSDGCGRNVSVFRTRSEQHARSPREPLPSTPDWSIFGAAYALLCTSSAPRVHIWHFIYPNTLGAKCALLLRMYSAVDKVHSAKVGVCTACVRVYSAMH